MSFFTRLCSQNGSKLIYHAKHVLMSEAISFYIPGKEEAVCFTSEEEEGNLVRKCWITWKRCRIGLTKFYVKNSVDIVEKNLTEVFDGYLRELIFLGYNSSKYDLKLIKPKLIEHLGKKNRFHE